MEKLTKVKAEKLEKIKRARKKTKNKKRRIKFKITQKILAGIFSIVLAALISNFILSYSVSRMDKSSQKVWGKYFPMVSGLGSIQKDLALLENKSLKYYNANLPAARDEIEIAMNDTKRSLKESFSEILGYVEKEPGEKGAYAAFEELYELYLESYENSIQKAKENYATAAYMMYLNEVEPLSKELSLMIEELNIEINAEVKSEIFHLDALSRRISILLVISMICIFIFFLIDWIMIKRSLVSPIRKAEKSLKNIIESMEEGKADLTEDLPIYTMDEIGEFVTGINRFMEILRVVIRDIREVTEVLNTNSKELNQEISDSSKRIENISFSMQEMAAMMEESSAAMEEITALSETITVHILSAGERIGEGTEIAGGIHHRAEGLKDKILESRNAMKEMTGQMNLRVKEAIEKAKQVEQIEFLTKVILDITGRTNLLAINASIEASRAGEAGKGFKVVADEIRTLAENSKNTVNQIQSVSKIIIGSVEELSKDAYEILSYVDHEVASDYEMFVKNSDDYYEDANTIIMLMSEFKEIISGTEKSVKEIVMSLEEITKSASGHSGSIQEIAADSDILTNNLTGIEEKSHQNVSSVNSLNQVISMFTKV